MFTIKFQPESKNYRFEKNNGAVALEGTIVQVSKFAISQGVQQKELTLAYQVMAENVHMIAEFGIRGCFLYSHNGRKESNHLSMVH